MSLCTITGVLRRPDGAAMILTPVVFTRGSGVVGLGDQTVAPQRITATTDVVGGLTVQLYPGQYQGEILSDAIPQRQRIFRVGVPEAPSAFLRDIIDQAAPISPSLVLEAVAARDAAEDARDAAQAAEAGAQAISGLEGGVQTSPTDDTAGRVLTVGAFGLGVGGGPDALVGDANDINRRAGFYAYRDAEGSINGPEGVNRGGLLVLRHGGAFSSTVDHTQLMIVEMPTAQRGVIYSRGRSNADWSPWRRHIDTGNTTEDTNGFIKAASPILRLSRDGVSEPVQPVGAAFERVGLGHYRIGGTQGLAQDGWQIELPRDHNGNLLIAVDTDWTDGVLTVWVGEPTWQAGRIERGAPMDVPEGRWIDLRMQPALTETEQ